MAKKGSHKNSKAAKIRVLLAEGLSVKEIATKLKVDANYVHTTKWHWQKKQVKGKKAAVIKPAAVKPAVQLPLFDAVNHPPHYTDGGIETIAFIEAKQLGYHLGNAVKYISRAGKKQDEVEDLKKAVWYINRRLDSLTK